MVISKKPSGSPLVLMTVTVLSAAALSAFAGNSACVKTFPIGISFVKEMAYIPEVDGWDKCQPGQYASDSQKVAAKWDSVYKWVQKQYTPSTIRALSNWARKQMTAYGRTPGLKGARFIPVRVREDHRKLVFEAVADTLPVHQQIVTRYLKIFLLYDSSTGEIVTVTVTIRGELAE